MMTHPEASIEITVTSKRGGPLLLHEQFKINRELVAILFLALFALPAADEPSDFIHQPGGMFQLL